MSASAGTKGSKSWRRGTWNSAGSGRSAAAALTPGAVGVQPRAELGVELGGLALGDAAQSERPHESVGASPAVPAISASRPAPIRR